MYFISCLSPHCSTKNRVYVNHFLIGDFLNVYEGYTEKALATHSSTLAWKIPWMEEPGRLQSMGSLRVGYD